MEKTHILKDIHINIPVNKIYQRMGYPLNYIPDITHNRDKQIEFDIRYAMGNIKVDLVYTIGTNIFKSNDLANMLKNCDQTVIMASTISPIFMKIIKDKIKNEQLSSAVIYDAVASVAVDKGLAFISEHINKELKKENKQVLKKRFSAGYGDLDISNQKIIYDTLSLKDLGVKISKTFMLTPEKTVTAITGIEKTEASGQRPEARQKRKKL
ncbi:MAG: hypothetical protein PHQ52_06880 [Candidatus Omnitrophica bacterium]|nr:hypothetical protein [Candidatus Omnitrophota bacterium]